MKQVSPAMAEKVWAVAGKIVWTAEDWADFHNSLTAVFMRISARHAKRKINEQAADSAPASVDGKTNGSRIVPTSDG